MEPEKIDYCGLAHQGRWQIAINGFFGGRVYTSTNGKSTLVNHGTEMI